MKLSDSRFYRFLTDVVKIATSRQRLRELWHIPLYSNAFYLMIASMATSLLSFTFWIIAARFYSVESVGLASAAIAAVGLVATFVHLGLGMGLVRFLPHSGENANSMVNTTFTIGILTAIVTAFIFVAGLGFWSPALLFLRQDPIYFAAFIILSIVYQVWYLIEHTYIAKRRAGFVTAQSLIFNLLKLPLVILLAAVFHTFGIFASWGISLGVAALLGMFLFLPRVQPDYRPFFAVNREVVNVMMRFSFANYLSTLFWFAPGMILPIMVVNLLGAEPNAYFYIAWSIGTVLPLIIGAVSTSLFAEGSYDEETLEPNTWRTLKIAFIILVPVVILVLAIAPQLLLLFGGAYSENATTLLRILAISALPTVINITYIQVKRVEKKLKVLVGFTAFAAVVSLGLAYLLLPTIGINGAGIAWLVTQGILGLVVVASLLKGRHARKVEPNHEK